MNQSGWDIFTRLCLSSKDARNLSLLFDLLLTHEERDSIATRCLIIEALLKKERTQRDLVDALHVSIAKITRGSNELKRTSPDVLDFLKEQLL